VFIAALWASPRRRRTRHQLTIGMLALILVRRAMHWPESDLTAAAKPANRAALSVITGQVLHGFFDVTVWFLIGGLIVLVLALLAGPSRWAAATRAWAAVPPGPPASWCRPRAATPAATRRSPGSAATSTCSASAAP
jgi:uncharacterized membrane protein